MHVCMTQAVGEEDEEGGEEGGEAAGVEGAQAGGAEEEEEEDEEALQARLAKEGIQIEVRFTCCSSCAHLALCACGICR